MTDIDSDLPADVLDDVNRITAQLTAVLMGDDACSQPTVALNSVIRLLVAVIVSQQLDSSMVLQFTARVHAELVNQISANPSGTMH